MRPSSSLLSLALVLPAGLLLAGCATRYTSSVPPDTAAHANERFAELEATPPDPRTANPELRQRLDQLFADRPDYVAALARHDTSAHLPRVRSMTPPVYPAGLAHVRATVKVAFAVDPEGHVQDARVLESPDARFDPAAVEAVQKWTFLPGSVAGQPALFVIVVPIQFDGVKKAK